MLTLEISAKHPVARLREEARAYFAGELGLEEDETRGPGQMVFSGAGGYVSLEFIEDGEDHPRVILTTSEFEHQAREFARAVGTPTRS